MHSPGEKSYVESRVLLELTVLNDFCTSAPLFDPYILILSSQRDHFVSEGSDIRFDMSSKLWATPHRRVDLAPKASCMQVRQQELEIAQALLDELVAASGSMATADEEDVRLEGKLCLLLALMGVLDRRQVGCPGNGGLVRRILTGATHTHACPVSFTLAMKMCATAPQM